MSEITEKVKIAKEIALHLNYASTEQKNCGLEAMAKALINNSNFIMTENQKDQNQAKLNGISEAMLDRLSLNTKRIKEMSEGLIQIKNLEDPIGIILEERIRPNGLLIKKVRVPIGVIAIIYEARPNVTVDAVGLTLKSGNAVVLRGSASALNSNKAIVKILNEALAKENFPKNTISLIEDGNRDSIKELVTQNGFIDLVIPRGGASLIKTVVQNATVPSIETGLGNCHVYIDASADLKMALQITDNAKTQRPSVCNAAETLLIHEKIAPKFLPEIIKIFKNKKVIMLGCSQTIKYADSIMLASEEDFATEFNDYKITIKIVSSTQMAIDHINKFGTKHTEAIVSNSQADQKLFQQQVDAAAIMINTTTRFTDGFEFGFGAEIGISTQKIHARGPMGLNELTIYKYLVQGKGQIRQ